MMSNKQTAMLLVGLLIQLLAVHQGQGTWELSVFMYSFSNPGHKCIDCRVNTTDSLEEPGCCDDFTRKDVCDLSRGCELFIETCARDAYSDPTVLQCPGPMITTGDITIETDEQIFNPRKFLGSLLGQTWQGGSQMFFKMQDYSLNANNKLVDTFAIDLIIPLGTTINRTTYTGHYGLATIDVSFKLACAEFYDGPLCTQCIQGFTGDSCDVNINECLSVDCSGRGQCVDGMNSYTCDCDPGYTGTVCENEIDECVTESVDCGDNRHCEDGLNSYTCVCDPGSSCAQGSPTSPEESFSIPLMGGVVAGAVTLSIAVLLVVIICACVFVKRKKRRNNTTNSTENDMQDNPTYGKGNSQQVATEWYVPTIVKTAPNVGYGVRPVGYGVQPSTYLTEEGMEVANKYHETGDDYEHLYEDITRL